MEESLTGSQEVVGSSPVQVANSPKAQTANHYIYYPFKIKK